MQLMQILDRITDATYQITSASIFNNSVYIGADQNITCRSDFLGFRCGIIRLPIMLVPRLPSQMGSCMLEDDDGNEYCINATTGALVWKDDSGKSPHCDILCKWADLSWRIYRY